MENMEAAMAIRAAIIIRLCVVIVIPSLSSKMD
jgi:hypothetical protein